jgi:diaminopimelate epimerase
MQYEFIKVNPTENMTIFIKSFVNREEQVNLAKKVMAYGNLYAEQVGFIENKPDGVVRLQMMGGEFCVNATRSLAAVLVREHHASIREVGGLFKVPIEVSGTEAIHMSEVSATDDYEVYEVSLEMPLHTGYEEITIDYEEGQINGTLVSFDGITHLVVPADNIKSKLDFYHTIVNKLFLPEVEAIGIMFYDDKNSFIEPLVYVRETDTLIWEKGCGSGTAALGIYLTHITGSSVSQSVNQPGGSMTVSTVWSNGRVDKVIIGGKVAIVAEGSVYIP